MTLAPVDGGSGYYARFHNGLPASASYFPIGVWFESVVSQADVNQDRAAGLNLYVVLTANSNLSLVQTNGMRTFLQQEEWRNNAPARASPAVSGWVLGDEFDMQLSPTAGYASLNQILGSLPADRRLRYSNYGKGVSFWLTDAEAARYVNDFEDVVSDDNYWFTDENICSGTEGGQLVAGGADLSPAECHRAANYGATVRRLRGLENPASSKPVWAFVELGHPASEDDWPTITPAQVRAAVWQSLIAGARGIIYFNHSFGGPNQTQHILREGTSAGSPYAPIRSVVTATDRQIQDLAGVLNSPTVSLGLVAGTGNHGDGEVGQGPQAVRVQEEQEVQEDKGAPVPVCRLGGIVCHGKVLAALRRPGEGRGRGRESGHPGSQGDLQRRLRQRKRDSHLPDQGRIDLRPAAQG